MRCRKWPRSQTHFSLIPHPPTKTSSPSPASSYNETESCMEASPGEWVRGQSSHTAVPPPHPVSLAPQGPAWAPGLQRVCIPRPGSGLRVGGEQRLSLSGDATCQPQAGPLERPLPNMDRGTGSRAWAEGALPASLCQAPSWLPASDRARGTERSCSRTACSLGNGHSSS